MGDRQEKNPIPNRWLRCPRKSSNSIVNKFLVFKTPLSDKFNDQVPVDCRFPPKMIFEFYDAKKMKIGLWIDLTNTSRFYNKQEVEEKNCKYLKLQCRGHGETPTLDQTKAFINICHKFITQHPLEFIAVHCTHGFNRSGFMIVSYLVEKMDCAIEVALHEFSRSREPGIYKQDYLDELYRRYGDEDVPSAPPLPDWCNEEENFHDRDEEDFPESSTSSSKKPSNGRKYKFLNKNPVFMTGVKGVSVFQEQPKARNLQEKVQKMCGLNGSSGFPGSQPVSMTVQNIKLLQEKPYRVSWKADGTRYMMLIDGEDEVYFFDRDNSIFKVKGIRFVHRTNLKRHIVNTLIDGEMVIDIVNDQKIPRYLVYDIITFEGQYVGSMPFYPNRLKYISDDLIKPRYAAMEKGFINKLAEPFSIRNKEFWDVTQTANLLGERFSKSLSHPPDGLIFQPSKEPYKTGSCFDVLKWKPLNMNSVDFRLKIMRDDRIGMVPTKVGCLYVGQLDKPFCQMRYTNELKDLDNKIIECKYEKDKWIFMRERTDKSFPNSYTTAIAVWESISNPVTKEHLIKFIATHRYRDDSDVMPPPSKRMRR